MRADTLEIVIANDMQDMPKIFGAEFYFMHRVDLHTELRRLATEPDGQTEPTKITLSSEVIDVNVDTAELTLKDGSKHTKDLIVAADGVHVRPASLDIPVANAYKVVPHHQSPWKQQSSLPNWPICLPLLDSR